MHPRPPRTRRRRGGNLLGAAAGGLLGIVGWPRRLPRLCVARQQVESAFQDLLRGGEDLRRQPRRRGLRLRRHVLEADAVTNQQDTGVRSAQSLRHTRLRLEQVPW